MVWTLPPESSLRPQTEPVFNTDADTIAHQWMRQQSGEGAEEKEHFTIFL